MCMICRGLKNNKMTVEQAEEKYQEFLDILDAPPKVDEELRNFLAAKSPWDKEWQK